MDVTSCYGEVTCAAANDEVHRLDSGQDSLWTESESRSSRHQLDSGHIFPPAGTSRLLHPLYGAHRSMVHCAPKTFTRHVLRDGRKLFRGDVGVGLLRGES